MICQARKTHILRGNISVYTGLARAQSRCKTKTATERPDSNGSWCHYYYKVGTIRLVSSESWNVLTMSSSVRSQPVYIQCQCASMEDFGYHVLLCGGTVCGSSLQSVTQIKPRQGCKSARTISDSTLFAPGLWSSLSVGLALPGWSIFCFKESAAVLRQSIRSTVPFQIWGFAFFIIDNNSLEKFELLPKRVRDGTGLLIEANDWIVLQLCHVYKWI